MIPDFAFKVALLWPGDASARRAATLPQSRLHGVADALAAVGVASEPAVYTDELADEVREQLLGVDGVLVWVNPIEKNRDRSVLDALLRDVAKEGVFVSAHPDTIDKLGTKEVLHRTRAMSWGCDTRLYESAAALRDRFPRCLEESGPRVLKQYRGNGGSGVWKVELLAATKSTTRPMPAAHRVRVRHAQRGCIEEEMLLTDFIARCEPYFSRSGRMIDQAYQARLTDGMIRCYLAGDKVVGFGEQLVNALYPPAPGAAPADAPQPGPRLYYPPNRPDFQALRTKMEMEWVPEMCRMLILDSATLPVIWDADFLYGPKSDAGDDTYVLCEINVSSVYPFPAEALPPLARRVHDRLERIAMFR